ncbi:MAG: glycosyltransferase, partial [Gammaproteobacteria bacterium]|nr:glycosyltransferase [Gammaproteobacteria bacterium]
AFFEAQFGAGNVHVIPTGVNLDLYAYEPPGAQTEPQVVFSGSMDWLANIDAIEFFMAEVWPRVAAAHPRARFTVIGRSPPARLVEAAQRRGLNWTFTGFVDDVRPYIRAAQACVIPLRVAGGTRLKVYESMAMGCPVVSTAIGVEGLPLTPGRHYELADAPQAFADALIGLLAEPARGRLLAEHARRHVEEHCSHRVVARVFENICAHVALRAPPAAGSGPDRS